MQERTGIQREYVHVRRKENGILTYGGDQGFFDSAKGAEADKRKQTSGCGIIAFSDLLLYLYHSRDLTWNHKDLILFYNLP